MGSEASEVATWAIHSGRLVSQEPVLRCGEAYPSRCWTVSSSAIQVPTEQ